MKRAGRLLACGVVLGLLWQPIASAEQLPLSGSLGAHDPTLFRDGTTNFVAATNGTLRSAPSLTGPWVNLGSVPKAQWTFAVSSGALWAPHVQKIGATYYMYYAQSNFGTNNSAIGLKTTQTPAIPSSWQLRLTPASVVEAALASSADEPSPSFEPTSRYSRVKP